MKKITWTAPDSTPGIGGRTFTDGVVVQHGGETMVDFGVQVINGNKMTLKVRVADKPELAAQANAVLAEIEATKKAELAAKQAANERVESGEESITIRYRDGEILAGYEAFGHAGQLLIKLGLAEHVSGWGVLVKDEVVKSLGKEFAYPDAVAFAAPAMKEKAAKKNAAESAKREQLSAAIAKAVETGEPQYLRHWTETRRANEGGEWGEYLFIVTEYVGPDGVVFTQAVNTY